ncbi:MAG: NADH:flavin oxidoreductase, partial [Planctomycetota bacterium]
MTQTRRNKWPIEETSWPTREEAREALLFSPIQIGPLTARTRTWIPAMVPWRCTEDGFVTPDILDWYGRFAAGQPGVLVVEATGIRDVPSGPLMRAGHERFVPGLSDLVQRVAERSQGQTRLMIQLIDFLNIRRRPEKTKFVQRFLSITEAHREAL